MNKAEADCLAARLTADGHTVTRVDTIYHPRYGAMPDRYYVLAVGPQGYSDYWHSADQYDFAREFAAVMAPFDDPAVVSVTRIDADTLKVVRRDNC